MREPVIRDAVVGDAEAIARIHVRAWQVAYRRIVHDAFLDSLSVADRTARWRERLAGDEESTVVIESDGAIVGWATYGEARDDDAADNVGELHAIYFDPSSWRQGLGTVLYREIEKRLRFAGFTEVTLWVLEANERARKFYASIGYSADGGRRLRERQGADVPEIDVRYRKTF